MSRGVWIRFLLVLGLLAGCVALALNKEPNLGLDLRGGAQFVFQAKSTESTEATAENVDKTVEVLRGRVDALGVAESTLVRQGDDRILVELPGVASDEEAQAAEEKIGQTAQLTAHPVVAQATKGAEPSKKGNQVVPADGGEFLEIGKPVLSGDDITGASAVQRENSVDYVVSLEFSGEGGDA
ncbi:MAG TPA: protein translocase subunit SecD, partial [Nocardioides sp.]